MQTLTKREQSLAEAMAQNAINKHNIPDTYHDDIQSAANLGLCVALKRVDSTMPLTGVPIVGDSLRDLQAGVALGASPHLVLTGKGEKTLAKEMLPEGTQIHADLLAFANALLENKV